MSTGQIIGLSFYLMVHQNTHLYLDTYVIVVVCVPRNDHLDEFCENVIYRILLGVACG